MNRSDQPVTTSPAAATPAAPTAGELLDDVRAQASSWRRLCWLLTILLLLAALALLTTFQAPRVFALSGGAQEEHARNEAMRIREVVDLYVRKTNDPNVTFAKLVTEDSGGHRWLESANDEAPKDPWGTPYELRRGDKPGRWIVLSAGPDQQMDTDDDVRSFTR